MKIEQTIPVLDFRDFVGSCGTRDSGAARAAFVDAAGRALGDLGFFALEHHGVAQDLIRQCYAQAEQFFLLPEAVKRQYVLPGGLGQRGYTPFGTEHAKDQVSRDLKEFWQVGRTWQGDSGTTSGPLGEVMAPNVWPAEVPEFETGMRALYEGLEQCAFALLEACAEALGLPAATFRAMAENGDSILRVIHYPEVPAERDPAAVRAAAHEDINFVTLLCESTAPGLELLTREGEWRPVRALPGQIVVDSGDMLQNLTNGLLRSTTHRVVNPHPDRESRMSMPFFAHPRPEIDLSPLPALVARTGGTSRFPSWTARAMLEDRLRAIGL